MRARPRRADLAVAEKKNPAGDLFCPDGFNYAGFMIDTWRPNNKPNDCPVPARSLTASAKSLVSI
jgi:hypothetical protein